MDRVAKLLLTSWSVDQMQHDMRLGRLHKARFCLWRGIVCSFMFSAILQRAWDGMRLQAIFFSYPSVSVGKFVCLSDQGMHLFGFPWQT